MKFDAGGIDFQLLIKEIREVRGLTQEQLAREVGVTFSTVNGWENGKHRPIPALGRLLVELADAAGVRARPRSAHTRSRSSRNGRRVGTA